MVHGAREFIPWLLVLSEYWAWLIQLDHWMLEYR